MLTFAEEDFRNVEDELRKLIHEHWSEVTSDTNLPLDPDWEMYRYLAQTRLVLVTARTPSGELVGYVIHLIHRPLHYKYLRMAVDDAHFLKREHRRGTAGIKMIRAVEDILRDKGVQRVSYHSKSRPDINKKPVFERMGYHLHEYIFTKQL